jgi:hypothetical protein
LLRYPHTGILESEGGACLVGTDRWQTANIERGKPRVYIQQFLDLRMPEDAYQQVVKSLELEQPFEAEAVTRVMEAYLEDLDDGSQCDEVHLQRGDGLVILMTVVSFPYKQVVYDRLLSTFLAKKALGATE